ncbi:3157_t:CDS:2 [Rhizophagus irregularis]|nr:3157_t:CDS:2 [Rhizophagus irregularis]
MQRYISGGKIDRKPLTQLSKIVPYNSKQIYNLWVNKLDPNLCLLSDIPIASYERDYIYEWVEQQIDANVKKISWKTLQTNMKEKFGKLRPRNDLKNIWINCENEIDPLNSPMSDDFNSLFFQPTETEISTTTPEVENNMILDDFEWALDFSYLE